MNILYCTQSNSLHLFHELNSELAQELHISNVGYTVADSYNYEKWLSENLDFENGCQSLLKEWEVTNNRDRQPDLKKLADYERELGGDAGLFGAIVADRRLFMGPDCTYTQDYRRRFTDSELLCILQKGLEETERLFDKLQPDLLVSFICVTMLDYLAYLFAKARGVRVLNLRPTRVGDRVCFSNTLNDPSAELSAAIIKIEQGYQSEFKQQAIGYIKRVKEIHGRYEGVIPPSDKPALKANISRFLKLSAVFRAVRSYFSYRNSIAVNDNHVSDPLRSMIFTALINPQRAKKTRFLLKESFVSEESLKKLSYVFFPLHTEPEVSLLVYGRPYVNQIEIIRMLAMSLPIDMVLIVKEHPWMVGKRTMNAYRDMLNIPRVKIANPKIEARRLIQESEMVAVITGSVALEAAMLGKPVITFGDCPYNLLPECMVRRCVDPRNIQVLIRDVLKNYSFDEQAMENYIAAVYETSASVNLYSELLQKKNVHTEDKGSSRSEIVKLAEYFKKNLQATEDSNMMQSECVAKW